MPTRRDALVLPFLIAAAPAFAQVAVDPSPQADGVTREVLALRERIRAAVAKRDRAALEAAYLDNFNHLRDSGRVDLKDDRIALLIAGEPAIETAPADNLVVQVYGPATAAVTAVSPIRDRATGRTVPFRWVTIFVKQADGWRVALSQASRMKRR